ncbi:MAG: extracellular matrix/biofilm biosynthesis regulator RemA family protein, partial [Dehalococcoidia bacterium]
MALDLLHIGFGNYVPTSRVVAIMSPDSAPIKRLIQSGKSDGRAID